MSNLKKVYYIISSLFLLIVIVAFAAEITLYVKISNLQSAYAEQKYYNDKLEEKENILKNLYNNYSELKKDEEIILETLPSDKDASKLVADLNSIAQRSNLKFTSVESTVAKTKGSKGHKLADQSLLQTIKGKYGYEMPLSIKVEGSYNNLPAFIEGIESYQRLINITLIEIEEITGDRATTSDYIEATLNITAYLKR